MATTEELLGQILEEMKKQGERSPLDDAKERTTQSTPWRPSATGSDVKKVADVVPRIPHIINHILPVANTWYEIKMPPNTIMWILKARGSHDLMYCYEPTNATYMTLPSGETLTEKTVPNRSIWSIFVMCETANETAELEIWLYA